MSLVCEENLGSGTLTERTAVSPSRASSPVSVSGLSSANARAYSSTSAFWRLEPLSVRRKSTSQSERPTMPSFCSRLSAATTSGKPNSQASFSQKYCNSCSVR